MTHRGTRTGRTRDGASDGEQTLDGRSQVALCPWTRERHTHTHTARGDGLSPRFGCHILGARRGISQGKEDPQLAEWPLSLASFGACGHNNEMQEEGRPNNYEML